MDFLLIIKELSIVIVIWVSIYGIDSWRREHSGKRKIELAEETMALFYEARDTISYLRYPVGSIDEYSNIARAENESQISFEARKNANVVFNRYNEKKVLFNKLHSLRYRFMAQIGKDESKPFDDIKEVVNEIFLSARMLSRLWARDHFRTEEQWNNHVKHQQKHEAVFWDSLESDDPINAKVDKIINSIESTCKYVISGEESLYHFLNKPIFIKKK